MHPQAAEPVKLFVGTLSNDSERLARAREALVQAFGPIDYESEPIPFTVTSYYTDEMGPNLSRVFYAFEHPVSPENLVEIKLRTNAIEDELRVDGHRKVNLDPGYLDHGKTVLASAKYAAQKIHLGKGIYADLTLTYEKGKFTAFPWTFPDFTNGCYDRVLMRIRERFKNQTRRAP